MSTVEKEKKSETSDQRLWRNTRLLYNVGKTALVAGMLLSEKMIGMAYAENNNQTKEVVDGMRRSLYQNQTEGYIPRIETRPEAVSLPESQTVDKIWPGLGKLIDEHEAASKNALQGEAQGRSDRTSSEQREVRRGIPLKNKVKIARFSGETHLRKETPEREIPQSMMETQQGEQDKGKEAEPLNLGKEEIDFLQSFLDALKQNKKALQGFKDVLNDKKIVEGVKDLMQDEKVREYVISEMKNKKNVKQAALSFENPQVLQNLKEGLNNEEDRKFFKHLMLDKEFRGRVLLEAENNLPWGKLSLKNSTDITGTELADIRARLQGRQDLLNLAEGYNLSMAQFQATRHEIGLPSDQLLAVAWQLDSTHVLVYEELNKPV